VGEGAAAEALLLNDPRELRPNPNGWLRIVRNRLKAGFMACAITLGGVRSIALGAIMAIRPHPRPAREILAQPSIRACGGNVTITFRVGARPPSSACSAPASITSRASTARTQLQAALDSTALMVAKEAPKT